MPIPPGMTVDVAAINRAMEQALAIHAVPEPQMGVDLAAADPGFIDRMTERLAEQNARLFAEARAQEQGWRPDPNEPDVEIRVKRDEERLCYDIEARFRPRTGEQEQRVRSMVRDSELRTAREWVGINVIPDETMEDRVLNEHIRMTVDRLCAERRRAEYERQQDLRRRRATPYAFNFWSSAGAAATTITYQWQNYFSDNYFTNNNTAVGWANVQSSWQYQPKPLTPEQRAEWEAQQAKAKAEAARREIEWKAAEKNAEKLLLDVIGRHRFRVWRKKGVVHVSSRKYRNLRYEIKAGEMIKLHERKGRTWRVRKDKLCIHLATRHPRGDEVAALYVLARFDEDDLWKTANHHYRDQEAPLELAA